MTRVKRHYCDHKQHRVFIEDKDNNWCYSSYKIPVTISYKRRHYEKKKAYSTSDVVSSSPLKEFQPQLGSG